MEHHYSSPNRVKASELRVAAVVAATLAAFTGLADITRSPDATAVSSSGAVNTTVGHSAVSDDGPLNTFPVGAVIMIR